MNILMSGSGSGGHIYPCISLYQYLKKYFDVYIIIFKKIDKKIYDLANIKYYYIDDEFSVSKKLRLIKKFMIAKKVKKTLTFGGKNSFYVNLVSKYLNIDSFIFEQNVVLGKANKLNYLLCKKMFTNFYIGYKKEINIGNPNAFNIKCKKLNLFKNNKPIILITMGSLGSSSVDKIINKFIINNTKYNIIYVLGNNVKSKLKDNDTLKIFDFYTPLTDLINYSDIIISRAGASTLSEIIQLKKPSIIIPSPFVANDHQFKNAKNLLERKACIMIEEKELNHTNLNKEVFNLIFNIEYYNELKDNLAKLTNVNNFQLIKETILNDNI